MDEDSESSFYNSDSKSVLIADTNKLLSAVGIGAKKITSMEELIRVAPSMFVAIFEALYHMKIDGVVRNPQTREDYIANAQLVIDNLSDQINIDLTHIGGESIVAGDFDALSNLVHIFVRIVSLASEEESVSTIESNSQTISSSRSSDSTEYSESYRDEGRDDNYHTKSRKGNSISAKQHKILANAFDKVYKMRHFRQNLLEAQKRREYILQSKTALAHVSNEKKARAANSIKQRRFSEDQSTKLRAHELKMLHQQEKLLTNLYSRLFKEAKQLRTLHRKEEIERTTQLTQQLENEISEIENRFSDRMDNLLTQKRQIESVSCPHYRELVGKLKELYEKKISSILLLNEQCMERKLLGRKEAILSHFPGVSNDDEWLNDLRSYPRTQKYKD